jgi:tetratricopeptide (TPR) repeat protein
MMFARGAAERLLVRRFPFPKQHLVRRVVRAPQEPLVRLRLPLGGGSRSLSFATAPTIETTTILQAEIVRERPASSSHVVLRQAKEELSVLEQALQAALTRHERLVAASATSTDKKQDSTDNKNKSDELLQASLQELRDCYENLTYWEDALTVEQALLQDFLISETDRAASLYRQGKLHMRMQQVPDAARYYQQAIALYQAAYSSSNDNDNDSVLYHADIGNILISMAGVHFHRNKLDSALSVLIESEEHFRKHGQEPSRTITTNTDNNHVVPHWDLVKCLQHQGLVYRMQEDYVLALEKYQEGLQAMTSFFSVPDIPNDDDKAADRAEKRQSLQMDIADMHAALDEPDEALVLYETIMKEDGERREDPSQDTALDGVMLHNMGKIRAQQGQKEQALIDLTKAAEIKERFAGETSPEVGKTLDALGAVHAVTGDKAKAHECFQRALLIARMHSESGDNDPTVMLALRNISVLKGQNVPKWGSDGE